MVSASSSALATCPDVKGEGDTHVERCVGLHVCKLQRYCQDMMCFEVGDSLDAHAGGAERISNLNAPSIPPWMAHGKGGPHASLPRERWAPCILAGTRPAEPVVCSPPVVCPANPAQHRTCARIVRREGAPERAIFFFFLRTYGMSGDSGGKNRVSVRREH